MIPLFLMAALSAMPLSVKHVTVDQDRITPIQCRIGWVTEVDFPRNRTIMDFRIGDEGFWDVSKHGNVLLVRPMDVPLVGGGQKTNISVWLDNGSYTLTAEEISKVKGASPDLKVIADMGTEEANLESQVVRAELLNAAKAENAALRQQLSFSEKRQVPSCEVPLQQEINSLRADYELFDRKGKGDFNPVVLHDERFTYVFLENTQELPTVMAFRDGKPDKVQVLFQAGKYTMPLVNEGVVIVGKSQIKFRRKERL